MDPNKHRRMKHEINELSETLYKEHNIIDVRTKRLIKDYYTDYVNKKEQIMELLQGESKNE